jgi:hypothetical protein
MQGLEGFDILESHPTAYPWYSRVQMFSGI